jgi:hypothetical protein
MNTLKDSLEDSIKTSVKLGIFPSAKTSLEHHLKSELVRFPLSLCKDLNNFDPARLSGTPYPKDNRPRGQDDLDSVLHHRQKIRHDGQTDPIWIAVKDWDYTLLDGAHRIVATYLENKRKIPAYIVRV